MMWLIIPIIWCGHLVQCPNPEQWCIITSVSWHIVLAMYAVYIKKQPLSTYRNITLLGSGPHFIQIECVSISNCFLFVLNRRFNNMNGSGCIFEHYGKIPEEIYKTECYRTPLEEAIFKNDQTMARELVQVSWGLSLFVSFCNEFGLHIDILILFRYFYT